MWPLIGISRPTHRSRASLGYGRSEIARLHGGLLGAECQTQDVGYFGGAAAVLAFDGGAKAVGIGVIYDGVLEIGIGFGGGGGGGSEQEADSDDALVTLSDEFLKVLGVIRLLARF